jgi:hypothetical protein
MAGTTFKIKQSAQSGKIPDAASLVQGELALNTADQKLYSKDSSGTVFEIASVSPNSILPSQTNHAGKILLTNGVSASWENKYDMDGGSSAEADYNASEGATIVYSL